MKKNGSCLELAAKDKECRHIGAGGTKNNVIVNEMVEVNV